MTYYRPDDTEILDTYTQTLNSTGQFPVYPSYPPTSPGSGSGGLGSGAGGGYTGSGGAGFSGGSVGGSGFSGGYNTPQPSFQPNDTRSTGIPRWVTVSVIAVLAVLCLVFGVIAAYQTNAAETLRNTLQSANDSYSQQVERNKTLSEQLSKAQAEIKSYESQLSGSQSDGSSAQSPQNPQFMDMSGIQGKTWAEAKAILAGRGLTSSDYTVITSNSKIIINPSNWKVVKVDAQNRIITVEQIQPTGDQIQDGVNDLGGGIGEFFGNIKKGFTQGE